MGKKVDVKQVAALAEVACNGVSDNLRSVALVRGTKFHIDVNAGNNGVISQAEFDRSDLLLKKKRLESIIFLRTALGK